MKKKTNIWRENQYKAIAMCDKFINVLEKLDCYDTWESILIERLINKKFEDAGLYNLPNFDDIAYMLEKSFGFKVFKGDSLAEEMKIEEFLAKLKENPYQLKLIA